MIRRFSKLMACAFASTKIRKVNPLKLGYNGKFISTLWTPITYRFADVPKHQVLKMPALSPTMSEGKVVKWNKNVGDALQEGDIICEVETDKATVGFEVTEKGFLAQRRETDKPIPVGTPLVVVVQKKQQVQSFTDFKFDSNESKTQPEKAQKQTPKKAQKQQTKQEKPKKTQKQQSKQEKPKKKEQKKQEQTQPKEQQSKQDTSLPKHQKLTMPALSPTMSEGKIVKWNIKQGQQFSQGDSLCDIETDKATVAFEATQKGVLAKILAKENSQMKVGEVLGLTVKKKEDASKFSNYSKSEKSKKSEKPTQKTQKSQSKKQKQEVSSEKSQQGSQNKQKQGGQKGDGSRVFASPAAKTLAGQKGINLSDVGKGSGPDGRILKQDIQGFKPAKKQAKEAEAPKQSAQKKQESSGQKQAPKPKAQKIEIPQNPFVETPLTNMRKTIAARLTQSKTTIPHYYIKVSVQMDRMNALRNELNANEKQNGVKISVNDIILKAMALALRDYPNVNAQWHGNVVKRFKYADVSVAVATEGGLITPIVYRADTLGLIDIAKRTKDIAKRARQGKLDPREYIGGTSTISNLGMYGIDSVTSVINPPQSTILGVGQTEKKIVYDKDASNPQKPYKVAEVMELIVSSDHRVVDGAMAAQWITRIKKYLEHPSQMLL